MSTHRGQLRYNLSGRATLEAGDPPQSLGVRLIDISEAGVSFLSDYAIAIGAMARLSFSVLDGTRSLAAAPLIQVQSCVLEKRMYRIGAQFSGSDPAQAQSITAIVEARSRTVKGR